MPLAFAPLLDGSVPIYLASAATWPEIKSSLKGDLAAFAAAAGFEPKAGRLALLPGPGGRIGAVLFGTEPSKGMPADPLLAGMLANILPAGVYHFAPPRLSSEAEEKAALAFLLSSYRFTKYKTAVGERPRLTAPDGIDASKVESIAAAIELGRDLVNTPANDMGPDALEAAALALAKRHKARSTVTRGETLLKQNFPLIHAVGRAASQEPRLVDLHWGAASDLKVTLVGKGVCFDTGGLDIKSDAGMLLMKKDMAGAATALSLADMIMQAKLPVRLRVLLPIVENAISATSFRPGDIYPSRKGLTVEIGNTDAEGRLILADALALADEEAPDLLFDFATLTGAARVALGPDLPAFYTRDSALAAELGRAGDAAADPVWRLPLWAPYDAWLEGKTANINNVGGNSFAGSIVAALFLGRFVDKSAAWAHFDIYGWNPTTRPGRPEGGEVQTARLLFEYLESRSGKKGAAN